MGDASSGQGDTGSHYWPHIKEAVAEILRPGHQGPGRRPQPSWEPQGGGAARLMFHTQRCLLVSRLQALLCPPSLAPSSEHLDLQCLALASNEIGLLLRPVGGGRTIVGSRPEG